MAASYLDWEVRTTGHDLNCSGFNPNRDTVNGVDYTQQDAAEITSLNWTVDGTNNTWIRSQALTDWVNGGKTLASLKGNHIHIAGLPIGGTVLFSWVASTGKPGAYYLQASGGGNPSWPTKPARFWINKTFTLENTSLPSGSNTWAWGDWDSLGYSTIYVRLGAENDASPATKNRDDIIADGKTWTRGAYEIVNVGTDANGPYLVLDRSPAAVSSTDGYGRIGGAMASPGGVSSVFIFYTTVRIFIKSGNYYITSGTNNVPGGGVATVGNGFGVIMIGYDIVRGQRPDSFPVFYVSTDCYMYTQSVWLEYTASQNATLWMNGYETGATDCRFTKRGDFALTVSAGIMFVCYFDNVTLILGTPTTLIGCYLKTCTLNAVNYSYGLLYCILDGCNSLPLSRGARVCGCVIANVSTCTIATHSYYLILFSDCIFYNIGTLTCSYSASPSAGISGTNYKYAVTTDNSSLNLTSLPANPFRDPTNGDFRLADNEAGRMLKQAGFGIPGPQGAPPMKFDVGAVQNSFYDIASGSGAFVLPPRTIGA